MNSTQLVVVAVAAVGCALALAACGGSANYSPEAATNPSKNSPLLLSECMHSHGIKSFPDPTFPAGGGIAEGVGSGVEPQSPAFQHAHAVCGGAGR